MHTVLHKMPPVGYTVRTGFFWRHFT